METSVHEFLRLERLHTLTKRRLKQLKKKRNFMAMDGRRRTVFGGNYIMHCDYCIR